jgi:hypothetical protein
MLRLLTPDDYTRVLVSSAWAEGISRQHDGLPADFTGDCHAGQKTPGSGGLHLPQ